MATLFKVYNKYKFDSTREMDYVHFLAVLRQSKLTSLFDLCSTHVSNIRQTVDGVLFPYTYLALGEKA